MFDKNIITYSAVSFAALTTGIAAWALLKWHATSKKLNKLVDKYVQEKEVQRYLTQHYGHLEDLPHLKNLIPKEAESYHAQLAKFVGAMCDLYSVSKVRVLDVGCGPGGMSFHLSTVFEEVVGTDTSMTMIIAGQQMKQFAEFSSPFSNEGGKNISLIKMRVPDGVDRERVIFWDEDVCGLSYTCGKFDCVVVSNTLTDMYDPKVFLENIGQYVRGGGLLIIADTYCWEDGPEEILVGKGDVLTFSLIKNILIPYWDFQKESNLSYYFPRCARLAEIGNSHVTVWTKKVDSIE